MIKRGWYKESVRHSLAAKGITSRRYNADNLAFTKSLAKATQEAKKNIEEQRAAQSKERAREITAQRALLDVANAPLSAAEKIELERAIEQGREKGEVRSLREVGEMGKKINIRLAVVGKLIEEAKTEQQLNQAEKLLENLHKDVVVLNTTEKVDTKGGKIVDPVVESALEEQQELRNDLKKKREKIIEENLPRGEIIGPSRTQRLKEYSREKLQRLKERSPIKINIQMERKTEKAPIEERKVIFDKKVKIL